MQSAGPRQPDHVHWHFDMIASGVEWSYVQGGSRKSGGRYMIKYGWDRGGKRRSWQTVGQRNLVVSLTSKSFILGHLLRNTVYNFWSARRVQAWNDVAQKSLDKVSSALRGNNLKVEQRGKYAKMTKLMRCVFILGVGKLIFGWDDILSTHCQLPPFFCPCILDALVRSLDCLCCVTCNFSCVVLGTHNFALKFNFNAWLGKFFASPASQTKWRDTGRNKRIVWITNK